MRQLGTLAVGLGLFGIGCGSDPAPAGDDTPPIDAADVDATVDAPPPAFTLTSTAFAEGGVIPQDQSCNGANTSPQLDWVEVPAGTQSFAVVLTDKSNGLVHAVIYDIPANLAGLPAGVDKLFAPTNVPGAHQTASYQSNVRGYNGPCPGSTHTYEFALFALDVATLPGATMTTTRAQATTLIASHDLSSAKLTGTYTP